MTERPTSTTAPAAAPAFDRYGVTLYQSNVLHILPTLPAKSIHMCVTSPPYWGLRSYLQCPRCGKHVSRATCKDCGFCNPQYKRLKQLVIGSERTPAEYVAKLVDVGREIWRVLRDDGTLWLNLGDGYQNAKGQAGGVDPKQPARRHGLRPQDVSIPGLKPKDLIGIPWLVAFALQADGWYLRDAIIWAKAEVDEDNNLDGSVMPGSQEDRCTSAYEMLFMLSKSARYYWDGEPLRAQSGAWPRNVWRINTQGCAKAHFAVFPKKLVEPCILAGTSEEGCCPGCGAPWRRVTEKTRIKRRRPNDRTSRHEAGNGVNSCGNTVAGVDVKTIGWKPTCKCDAGKAVPCTVLDPFMGTGTTAEVARQFGRRAIGCELSGEYMDMAKARFPQAGLFDAPKYEEAK